MRRERPGSSPRRSLREAAGLAATFLSLDGTADASVRFDDLVRVLERVGFQVRQRGDRPIFWHDELEEILSFEPRLGMARPYQVQLIRDLFVRHRLTEPTDGRASRG